MKRLAAALACVAACAGLHASAPALDGWLGPVQLEAAHDSFVADVQLAREEAFQRNTWVVMCKSSDGETCATAGGWEQGWILFADANANGRRDRSDRLILRVARLSPKLRMRAEAHALVASPTGTLRFVGIRARSAAVEFCGASATWVAARRIVLDASGESRDSGAGPARCS